MNEHRFEHIEHTADKGVLAYGDTLEEAFENIAYGMFSLMADLASYQPSDVLKVEISAEDEVSLLRKWLKELLFTFEVERVLPVDFSVKEIADGRLLAEVRVRPFGPDIEWLGSQVKAVTYHGMEVDKFEHGYRVQAIVDV
ncbi:MAG: archease [Armatimonadota bacterium]|nr:archease [Armatimonadota bacterium]